MINYDVKFIKEIESKFKNARVEMNFDNTHHIAAEVVKLIFDELESEVVHLVEEYIDG